MELRCQQCGTSRQYVRGDFLGDWVICSKCELPFSWRDPGTWVAEQSDFEMTVWAEQK